MSEEARVVAAELGPSVAAFTALSKGRRVAVVNTEIRHNPGMRAQAAWALVCMGMDAGAILGALHGVHS